MLLCYALVTLFLCAPFFSSCSPNAEYRCGILAVIFMIRCLSRKTLKLRVYCRLLNIINLGMDRVQSAFTSYYLCPHSNVK